MMGGSRHADTQRVLGKTNIITDYIDPATGAQLHPGCWSPRPESFAQHLRARSVLADPAGRRWPISRLIEPGDPYLVEGYSQKARLSLSNEKIDLLQGRAAPGTSPFLLVGPIPIGPDGGMVERFVGLNIPGLGDLQRRPIRPTPVYIPTIDIANQYDRRRRLSASSTRSTWWPTIQLGAGFHLPTRRLRPMAHCQNRFRPSGRRLNPLSGPVRRSICARGRRRSSNRSTGTPRFYFISDPPICRLLDPLRSLGVPRTGCSNIFQPATAGNRRRRAYEPLHPVRRPPPRPELIPTIDPATFTLEFANGRGSKAPTTLFWSCFGRTAARIH